MEDVPFLASRLPQADELERLIAVLDHSARPLLIHCSSGADRSGLASAVFLLLETDSGLARARAQLSLKYGHCAWTQSGWLDAFLDRYVAWLQSHELEHTPANCRWWMTRVYEPSGE